MDGEDLKAMLECLQTFRAGEESNNDWHARTGSNYPPQTKFLSLIRRISDFIAGCQQGNEVAAPVELGLRRRGDNAILLPLNEERIIIVLNKTEHVE
jgi:hypothetical protein